MLPDELWWVKPLGYIALAMIGGFLGYVTRTLEKRQTIQWVSALFKSMASGFVGLLVMFLCQAVEFSEQWTGVVVGVSGWLGAATTMLVLEDAVFKKLGLKSRNDQSKRS